jgi:hypothetical protein
MKWPPISGLLKRALNGAYIGLEPLHLSGYIDGQLFRFATRKITDAGRFSAFMRRRDVG